MTSDAAYEEASIRTGVQIELTTRLLSAMKPFIFYVVGIHVSCAAMAMRTGDVFFWYLFAGATAASIARGAVAIAFRRRQGPLTLALARRWELRYAVAVIGSNFVLVGMTVASFLSHDPAGYILAIAFALAQSAAVAARNSRIWIAVTLVTMSLLPIAVVSALSDDRFFHVVAALIVIYWLSLLETLKHNTSQLVELLTARRELAVAANHDALTGLLSRRRFDEVVTAAHHESGPFALVMIDLDGFKPVNDRYGHAAGDEILRQVGKRLMRVMRDRDFLARIGGDEFAVLLRDVADGGEVAVICERIARAFDAPFPLAGVTVSLSASAGAALRGRSGPTDIAGLKQVADDALYASKREGQSRARIVVPKLQAVS